MKFTFNEDQMIINLVNIFGVHNWELIYLYIPNHTIEEIKKRYFRFLKKYKEKKIWSNEEEFLLMHLVKIHGKHWKFLSYFFPKHSDIDLKNKYNILIWKNINKSIE